MVLVVLIDAYCTSAEIDARASGAKVAVALSPLVALCTASSHQGLVYNKNHFFRGIYHDSWCICIITLKEIEFGRFNHKNCVHSRMTAYNIYIYIYNYTYIYILFTQCVYIYIYIFFFYVFIYFYIDLFIYLCICMGYTMGCKRMYWYTYEGPIWVMSQEWYAKKYFNVSHHFPAWQLLYPRLLDKVILLVRSLGFSWVYDLLMFGNF